MEKRPSSGRRTERGSSQTPERLRLLFVDDEPAAARVLRRVLERHAPGWTLDWVTTAEECVRRGLSDEYDVVLIDENLGQGISGLRACRELRRNGCNMPLLVHAGDDSDDARLRAHDAGADGFLPKGLDPGELVARITEVFLRPPERTVRECGPLRVDLSAGAVTVNDAPVHLPDREYHLLLALTKRFGTSVSREWLCEFSGIEPGRDFKNLQNRVGSLRKMLGEAGRLIRTRRSEGYRLVRPTWPGFPSKKRGDFVSSAE